MAKMRVMVWNIEQYGCFPNGKNEAIVVNDFICFIAIAQGVDVIIIQELRNAGCVELVALSKMLELNTPFSWMYDYVPAGIPDKNAPENPNISFNDLSFKGTSNSEGYAVIYKANAIQKIKNGMSYQSAWDPQYHAGAIKLCLQAYYPFFDKKLTPPFYPINNGGLGPQTNARFPSATIPNLTPPLIVPHAAGAPLPPGTKPDPYQSSFSWFESRRPCSVRLNLNPAVEVLVYHAPSKDLAQEMSGPACNCLREIHDNKHFPNVIIAGDFNYTHTNDINDGFKHFKNALFIPGTLNKDGEYVGTMVHVISDEGKPKYIIGSPRDVVFFRTDQKVQMHSQVYNPILDLIVTKTKTTEPSALVNEFSKSKIFRNKVESIILEAIKTKNGSIYQYRDSANRFIKFLQTNSWGSLSADIRSNSAALFFRTLISDHLPLIINIDDGNKSNMV